MKFEAKRLKYALDALSPTLSHQQVDLHFNKHTKSYFKKLNELIKGTIYENAKTLEDMLTKKAIVNIDTPIFNNAAQCYNHDFYWQSLTPNKTKPDPDLLQQIEEDFQSFEKLKKDAIEKGTKFFGSGWAWIVLENGKLKVVTFANANNPLSHEKQHPLLCIDLWEHSYLYQEQYFADRKKYLESIWTVVNWDFANENFKKAKS